MAPRRVLHPLPGLGRAMHRYGLTCVSANGYGTTSERCVDCTAIESEPTFSDVARIRESPQESIGYIAPLGLDIAPLRLSLAAIRAATIAVVYE
jgi:hypothetical protein